MTVSTKLFLLVRQPHAESDIKIACLLDGSAFYCHKLILSQHDRFRRYPSFNEATFAEILVDDFPADLVHEALRFVYTNKIDVSFLLERSDCSPGHPLLTIGDLWRCLDYFLVDEEVVAEALGQGFISAPKKAIIDCILEISRCPPSQGVVQFTKMVLRNGRLEISDFLTQTGFGLWRGEAILLITECLCEGGFNLLDAWYRYNPNERGIFFERGLKIVGITPAIFGKLYGHSFLSGMGWKFLPPDLSPNPKKQQHWLGRKHREFFPIFSTEEISSILSPPIERDQEEAFVQTGIHHYPIFVGAISHEESIQFIEEGGDWENKFPGNIVGWVLGSAGMDHDCTVSVHDEKTTFSATLADKVYLLKSNEMVICSTKYRNPDHSVTYSFQLHINGCKRSRQPIRITTGRSIPVRFYLSAYSGNLIQLDTFPVSRSFI